MQESPPPISPPIIVNSTVSVPEVAELAVLENSEPDTKSEIAEITARYRTWLERFELFITCESLHGRPTEGTLDCLFKAGDVG